MHVKVSGYLWKKSLSNKIQWSRRYFRLKGSTLFYYHSPQDSSPRGYIVLKTGETPHYALVFCKKKTPKLIFFNFYFFLL